MKYMCHIFLALFAASTSFAATVNLSTLTTDYEAKNGDVLTGTLNGNKQHVMITIANGAKVTLSDATINGTNYGTFPWAGLTCLGNCNIVLKGSNTVKGFYGEYPGIQVAKRVSDGEYYTLTIEGDGSLDASSNGDGSGIGGELNGDCGNIAIKGGKVTATGGFRSAGIGCGLAGSFGNITISGGEVVAKGGENGAGIGGGSGGTSGDIIISGGKVTATGGSNAAGIGDGRRNNGDDVPKSGNITISGGEVVAKGGENAAGIGGGLGGKIGNITITNSVTKVVAIKGHGAPYSIGAGYAGVVDKVTVGGKVGAVEEGHFRFPNRVVDLSTLSGDYEAQDGDVLTGDLDGENNPRMITIADGAEVTLRKATIIGKKLKIHYWAGLTCLGNCTIVLSGANTVKGFNEDYPGIQAAKREGDGEEYTLTIEGDGSLDASSNGYGAGIGGAFSDYAINCGNIVINSGEIIATGGGSSPGIGSGLDAKCGDITINGGKVTATGGSRAAGIGGGYKEEYGAGGFSGNITISGGDVTATGGEFAAGIGSGENGKSGDITISGGVVIATGGEYAAGIGSGENGKVGNITIGYDVTSVVAVKGNHASYSIGKGEGSSAKTGTVTIVGENGPVETSPFNFPTRVVKLSTLTGDFEAQNGDVLTGELRGDSKPYKITIADGAKVILRDVKIYGTNEKVCKNGSESVSCEWAGLTCLGNCTIALSGSNTVRGFNEYYPGVQAAKQKGNGKEYTLTIEGDGYLYAYSNGYGAGIGSSRDGYCGNITISGGEVTGSGGVEAAGIGSGRDGICGNITISGGKVSAKGGNDAAGIGSGAYGGICGDITISGGEVATSAPYAAGIGSGQEGTSGNITISGGEVIAKGGSNAAGIGGSQKGISGGIIINGGKVTAMGGSYAAGIGSGDKGKSGDITITKDVTKVVAAKGVYAPYSIGAGLDGEVGKLNIVGKNDPVAKELFVFPDPAKLVNIETVCGDIYAVINGDYSGDEALNITEDVLVDMVVVDRTFPEIDGENNYSTIMLPFEINADKVKGIMQVYSFLGIGVDKQKRKYVAVKEVDKFEAYKPYLILLESGETSITIKSFEPFVLKATPTEANAFDVAQSDKYNQYGDYVFRGVVQGKTWGAEDDDVLGTDGAAAYGFASADDADISVGQFVKVGEGAYIRPFRGYIYKKPVPKKVKSNGGDLLRQTASIDDLPDVMDIVLVDRQKDGSERTTVIGQFNSRTGEIRMNRTKRTYDLKGRSVRDASRMAKGVYLKK